MNKEEFIGKMQMAYFGEKEALEECTQENQQLKEKIENQGIALAEINIVVKELKSKNNTLKKENKKLKEQLKQCGMEIQSLIERDIECPSNCDKLKGREKALNEIREYIKENSHYYSTDTGEVMFVIEEVKEESFCKDILEMIDEALGGNNEDD